MFCIKCGKEITDASKFCEFCGRSQKAEMSFGSEQHPHQPAASNVPLQPTPVYATHTHWNAPSRGKNSKIKNKKLLILIAAILVVIVLALLILSSLLGSGNYINQNDYPIAYVDTLYLPNGDTEEFPGCNIYIADFCYSSGNFVLVVQGEDSSTMYYFTKSGKKVIVEMDHPADYTNYHFNNVTLSNNGKAVLYIVNDDGDSTLYLYSGGKNKEITSDEVYEPAVLSPDGKTVLYTDEDEDAYLWKGGKAEKIGSDIYPVGVSNGGKLIYYLDDDNKLYVRNGKNDTKLGTNTLGRVLNIENSSILFADDDGKLKISKDGKKAVSLKGDSDSLFLYPNGESHFLYIGRYYANPIKDFENMFYMSDSKIYRINGKYESVLVANSDGESKLCKDGKTLFFLDKDTLYKINGISPSPKKIEIADDVLHFATLGDSKSLYYIDEDNELYYYNGGKTKEIDGAKASYICYLKKTDSVYYVDDGELYSSKNGSKGERVEGMDSDEIDYINSNGLFLEIQTYGDEDYLSSDGKIFYKTYKNYLEHN